MRHKFKATGHGYSNCEYCGLTAMEGRDKNEICVIGIEKRFKEIEEKILPKHRCIAGNSGRCIECNN